MPARCESSSAETLRRSGVMQVVGEENVFPATARVLEAENAAWDVAQKRLNPR